MVKNTLTIVFVLSWLMSPLSFSRGQDPKLKPPLLTFDDLQRKNLDLDEGPFRVEGYVIQTYKCPPCPAGAQCKPCLGDHIVVTDNVDEKDPAVIKRLRIFTNKPEQFELKRMYLFVVKLRGKKQTGRAIEEVDLISFDEADSPWPAV
jgi:hypothetical protein